MIAGTFLKPQEEGGGRKRGERREEEEAVEGEGGRRGAAPRAPGKAWCRLQGWLRAHAGRDTQQAPSAPTPPGRALSWPLPGPTGTRTLRPVVPGSSLGKLWQQGWGRTGGDQAQGSASGAAHRPQGPCITRSLREQRGLKCGGGRGADVRAASDGTCAHAAGRLHSQGKHSEVYERG